MKKFYVLLWLLFSAFILPSEASANDFKIIPASSCWWSPSYDWVAPTSGSTVPRPFEYDSTGEITMLASELGPDPYRVVSCPIVRDFTTNTTGLVDLRVRAYDTTTTGAVACSATSRSLDGIMSYTVGGPGSGFAFAGGYVEFAFSGGAALNHSWSGGTYVVDCTFVPNTKIISIYYVEQSGGDTN